MRDRIHQQILTQARRRMGFKIHLIVYVAVIGLQWLIWGLTWTGYACSIWPMLGWGIGLTAHFLAVFAGPIFFSMEREIDQVKKENNL